MEYAIERITTRDQDSVPSFLTIGRDYLAEVMTDRSPDERDRFLQSMLDRQGGPDRWLILLRREGEYIGFTHAKIDHDERPGWGYILEFYVVPSARRQGTGRLLYEHVARVLRSAGASQVWLSAFPKAEQFWHSLGFRETGDYEGDQKIMAAELR